MKKFAKAMVVGGITLGTVLGFNVTEHNGYQMKHRHKRKHHKAIIMIIMVIQSQVANSY